MTEKLKANLIKLKEKADVNGIHVNIDAHYGTGRSEDDNMWSIPEENHPILEIDNEDLINTDSDNKENNEKDDFENVLEIPISRADFCDIFDVVGDIIYENDVKDYESEDFKLWYYDSRYYILKKSSGILISWWKFHRLGYLNTCNIKMRKDDYEAFAKLLRADLNKNGYE